MVRCGVGYGGGGGWSVDGAGIGGLGGWELVELGLTVGGW